MVRALGLGFGMGTLADLAHALPDDLAEAVRAHTRGPVVRIGKVRMEIAELVENGNAVPLTVSVSSAMTPLDHVRSIAIFNEKNPQRDVAVFRFGPASGRALVSTRIRLATSQKLVAVAQMNDGSFWSQSVDVIVTIAACIETDG